jgi:hypothetical protein
MVSKAFITAGRAVFTVSNPAGERYTYRVQKSGDESRPAAWFVSLLTGPDNRHDYTYLGMLNPADGAVRLTRASNPGSARSASTRSEKSCRHLGIPLDESLGAAYTVSVRQGNLERE